MHPQQHSPVTYRLARPGDAGDIFRALQALAQSLGVAGRLQSTEEGILRHGFCPRPTFEVMIAEAEDRFAGMCLYFPFFSTWVGEPGVYVQDLYIAPEYRGRRIGESMLREVARRGRDQGYSHLRLTVDDGNDGGDRFYRRLGFQRSDDERLYKLTGPGFQALCAP